VPRRLRTGCGLRRGESETANHAPCGDLQVFPQSGRRDSNSGPLVPQVRRNGCGHLRPADFGPIQAPRRARGCDFFRPLVDTLLTSALAGSATLNPSELCPRIHFLGDPLRFRRCLLDHDEGLVVFDDGLYVVELMPTEDDEVI
jgi:hypothetical protein